LAAAVFNNTGNFSGLPVLLKALPGGMRTQMQKKDAAKAAHLRRLNPAKRDSFLLF